MVPINTHGDGIAKSLSEFIDWSRSCSNRFGIRNATLNVWFRGQSNAGWSLKPWLYRGEFNPDLEREMLRDFRAHAASYFDLHTKTDMDWLFLAQHHGIPTRIIDWTENALVGLYFSCCDLDLNADGVVWALNAWELNKTSNNVQAIPDTSQSFLHEYVVSISGDFSIISREIKGYLPVAVRPSYRFNRQNAQSGVFTVHGREKAGINAIPFIRKNRSSCLIKCVIPNERKALLLKELYAVGIHKGFLFQSIDGIAESIKYRYSNKFMT